MKLLIVDDEPLARERLGRLIARLEPDAAVLQAANGAEALEVISRENPELVLLDVRMPGMDGMEVASQLDVMPAPPAVIFCTAYDEYALEALRHQAVAYVLKPVREADLSRALASAGRVNRVQMATLREGEPGAGTGRQFVSSHTHRGLETLPLKDIRCFVAEQKYVAACAPQGELLLPDTLKDLEQEFAAEFVRVHRNAMVALAHIVRLEKEESEGGWRLVLDGVSHQPAVSRRHLSAVKKRLAER